MARMMFLTGMLLLATCMSLSCSTGVHSKEHRAIEAYNWLRQAMDDCIVFPGDWALINKLWALVDDDFFYVKAGKPKHAHTACNYTISVCNEEPRDGHCSTQLDLPIWGRYNTFGLGAGVPDLEHPPNVAVSPAAWKLLYKDNPIQASRRIWVIGKPFNSTYKGT
eukprot:TRINITY_DN5792_c0_g1_i1.p1 TRINITY_DN5792_c0_g1~~TRINITY_DN5792_c0_g1_i1.p1  ORF type:complete len:165 (-),score=15.72 TRINITY_DN5792_c0_g1_i1:426-920(-)